MTKTQPYQQKSLTSQAATSAVAIAQQSYISICNQEAQFGK